MLQSVIEHGYTKLGGIEEGGKGREQLKKKKERERARSGLR